VALVRKSYPRFEVRPFSSEAGCPRTRRAIGTLPRSTMQGSRTDHATPTDLLALADLRSKSIVSKGVARASRKRSM